jgi:hypothetical protein
MVGNGVVGGKGDIFVWLIVSPLFGGDGIAGLGSDGSVRLKAFELQPQKWIPR